MTQCENEMLVDISLVEAIIRNVTPYISNVQVKTIEEETVFRQCKHFAEIGDGCTTCQSCYNMEPKRDCIKKGELNLLLLNLLLSLMVKRLASVPH